MKSVVRASLITAALIAVFGLFLFELRGWQWNVIGYMRVEVVNDTSRPVTIQPCWDWGCHDLRLRETVIPAGHRHRIAGAYLNDFFQLIEAGVVRPHGQYWQFSGCLFGGFPAGTKLIVFRVSHEQPCPYVPEGSAGGG